MSTSTPTRVLRERPGVERRGDRSRGHLRVVPEAGPVGAPGVAPAGTAGHDARAGSPPPPLRLTRRGRLVLRGLVLMLLVVLLAVTGLALARSAQAEADPHAPVRTYVVMPGQTLWGIATELAPSADPRDTVALLVAANHLPSSSVYAGQQLVLPAELPAPR